jgi:hypothetical protein
MKKHTFAKRIAKLKEQEDFLVERIKSLISIEHRERVELLLIKSKVSEMKSLLASIKQQLPKNK